MRVIFDSKKGICINFLSTAVQTLNDPEKYATPVPRETQESFFPAEHEAGRTYIHSEPKVMIYVNCNSVGGLLPNDSFS